MERPGKAGRPRLRSRLWRLGRWYAPPWLKRVYRSARGRRRPTIPAADPGAAAPVEDSGVAVRVAVFSDDEQAWFASLLRALHPAGTVLQLIGRDRGADHDQDVNSTVITAGTDSHAHAALAAHGPFDVIVDATTDSAGDRVRRFRRTWFHLARGGRYCFRGDGPDDSAAVSVWPAISKLVDHRGRAPAGSLTKEDRAIATSMAQARVEGGMVMATCTRTATPILRESEAELVLRARPEIGSVLIKKPGRGCADAGSVRSNQPPPRVLDRAGEHPVTEVQLREYRDVLCCPHQVLLGHDLVWPDSFRHFTKRRLRNRHLDDLTPWFTRYRGDMSKPTDLAGSYFYLSSEVPGHFGHLMTEQLSRMWAWSLAKERHPDLKALLQPPDGRRGLTGFERDVLSAAGVPRQDFIVRKGVLRVERLLSATPMLSDPVYVHPELPEVWRRARASLIADAPGRDWPAKIFVSRGPNFDRRPCHNRAEVEEFVSRQGFTVVYPEDYSVPEQAMIFDRAERIAGFSGSGMFSLIFCGESKPVTLIAPESYTARNEYLIASAVGHRIAQLWCEPDVAHPTKGWHWNAYASGFRVDLERDGEFLADSLTSHW